MINRKRFYRAILLALCVALTACAALPSMAEDEGKTAPSTGAAEDGLMSLEEVKAENGREIDTVLTGADGTALTIKAQVNVAQVDEVPLLTLKNASVDMERVKRIFFGARAGEAFAANTHYYGSRAWRLPAQSHQERGYGASVSWSVNGKDHSTSLDYFNDDGAILYDDFPDDDILPYLEDVPTPDEAVCAALLDEKLAQLELGIQGHSLSLESPTNIGKKTGSYNLRYLPDYGVLPGIAEYTIRTVIGGAATFSVKGMTQMILNNPKYPEETGVVEEMLGIDQALDIVREHLGKGLKPRQDKAVEEITLSYRYVQDGVTGEVSAYPVWFFYMERDPLLTGDYGGSIGEKVEYERRDECFAVDVRSGVLEVITTSNVEVK